MDLLSSMRISASGLDAQETRMNTISSNIANAESVGYQRKDAVLVPDTDRESFGEILNNEMDEHAQGVLVTEISQDTKPARLVYDPHNPKANTDGYVAMPNVNTVEEMANMINASRAYESNITALNAAKSMALKALDIGK